MKSEIDISVRVTDNPPGRKLHSNPFTENHDDNVASSDGGEAVVLGPPSLEISQSSKSLEIFYLKFDDSIYERQCSPPVPEKDFVTAPIFNFFS